MAARATSKTKPTSSARSANARAAKKAVVSKKALPGKTRPGPSATGKTASATKRKTASKTGHKTGHKNGHQTGHRDNETETLAEQNRLLQAELKRAQARIKHLEELNKNVVNRIDWVIDSLQSALKR